MARTILRYHHDRASATRTAKLGNSVWALGRYLARYPEGLGIPFAAWSAAAYDAVGPVTWSLRYPTLYLLL